MLIKPEHKIMGAIGLFWTVVVVAIIYAADTSRMSGRPIADQVSRCIQSHIGAMAAADHVTDWPAEIYREVAQTCTRLYPGTNAQVSAAGK
jgi:hypothetical protein